MELLCREETGGRYVKFNESGKEIETPGCFMYSRGGMVPHLTDDNLNCVKDSDLFCHLPLSTIYEQPGVEIMEKFGASFHEFSSSQDKVWILSTNDSYAPKPDIYKYNEEKCISVWAPSGRRKITPDEYMKVLQVFSFDIAIPPSDTIPEGLTKKRCRKSAERSTRFLERCLQIKAEKKLSVPVCGVIEGGDSEVFREKSAKDIGDKNVDAYVLGGFNLIHSNWKNLLQLCTKHLKSDKAKIMFGVLTPMEVMDAVESNVDIFDTVIAYDAAERGCGLNFSYCTRTRTNRQHSSNPCNGNTAKKVKTEGENVRKDLSRYEINLNDKKYFNDNRPLVEGCQCYCCLHHVRAYVHHLLVTKEMLASVLLMMHNLTYWLEFFKEIRKSIEDKRFEDMKEIIEGNL